MEMIVNYLPLFGILALCFVFWKNAWVAMQEEGGEMERQGFVRFGTQPSHGVVGSCLSGTKGSLRF